MLDLRLSSRPFLSIGPQNAVQAIPLDTILKLERRGKLIQLLQSLVLKVAGVLVAHDLAEESLPQDAIDMPFDLPLLGIPSVDELLRDFLLEVAYHGLVNVGNVSVIAAPFIQTQTLLLV